MTHSHDKTTKNPGSSPGTIVHIGEQKINKSRIRLMQYDNSEILEKEFETIEECIASSNSLPGVKWINVDGLHDIELLKGIGKAFDIHPLVLEDIVNTKQRPKYEEHDHQIFIVLKMLYADPDESKVSSEQMSFVLGKDYILSFQERVGDVFGEVRKRIRTGGSGRIRKAGSDYLLYALTDAMVDHYFIVLENIANQLENADNELTENPSSTTLRQIHDLKKEIVLIKKQTWPLRELFASILRSESKLISKKTAIYFRDVQDHVFQILDSVESFREMISTMLDMYQSSISNKMNEVMKVLTIIATIFIPPTFVAGIYGMNFDSMPELHMKYGYFVVLGVISICIATMVFYFKKKRWI
ncbi:MAG: magnesium transporter [Candidatus Omnitrophota bacterium]|jgi:magnesium transporter